MGGDSDEPRKRSRFDVGPTESRFDRRSRSPVSRSNRARSRSPIKSVEMPDVDDGGKPGKAQSAAARAAEMAAKINASLQARKGVQHVDVPPIRTTATPPNTGPGASKSPSQPGASGPLNVEIYQQDGDFIKDIEINDLRNRYTLTKGSTQKMIKDKTGADVTTRGNYYPDKALATAANPPLFLHITSTTKERLEMAVAEINELMKQELPNLIDERRFRGSRRDQQDEQPQEPRPRRKWPEERIPVDLEPIRGFNLRAQVVGAGGAYVKHIQSETRCRVQIKGRGSGFIEHETGVESDEPMYLHVAGPEQDMVDQAKTLCISLLESVSQAYNDHKARPQQQGYGGGYDGGGQRGGYHNRGGDRQTSGGYGGGSAYGDNAGYGGNNGYGSAYGNQDYGAAQQATGAGDPAEQQRQYEAWAAYYAQNPDADPYKEYGGYAAVMASYQQQAYQQPGQGYGAGQAQSPTSNVAGVPPPPPPPSDNYGAGNGNGGYNAVPPPPGV